MSTEDFRLRNALVHYVLPVAILIVILKLLRKQVHRLIDRICAFIESKILPRIHAKFIKHKWELFKEMDTKGGPVNILEIGAGSGQNFKSYPEGSTVTCLDPNIFHKAYLYENLKALNPKIKLKDFVCGYGEDMNQFQREEFDIVVETLVLCSVTNVEKVLKEVKRVLKPGGKFYFLDHVAAKEKTALKFLQDRINILFFYDKWL